MLNKQKIKTSQKKTSQKKSSQKQEKVKMISSDKKKKGGNNNKKQNPELKRKNALTTYQINKYSANYHDMMHLPLIPGLTGPQKRTTVKEIDPEKFSKLYLGGIKF